MKKIDLKIRKILRILFGSISLTAAVFIFQACYGMPQDAYCDVRLTGTVTSKTTNLPIEGIKVAINGKSQNYGITDENGKFDFYAYFKNIDPDLKIQFLDIDGVENGNFADKIITINTVCNDAVNVDVVLEEK